MKEYNLTAKHVTLNLFAGAYPFTLAAGMDIDRNGFWLHGQLFGLGGVLSIEW